MLIQDIIPPRKEEGNQVSFLPKQRQIKKASKRALPVLLIAFLIIQIIVGPFVPFKFSLNPPRVSLQEAKAVTGTPIATCLELQSMENDLTASYYLTNDIDCSNTINWNSGAGFEPIGNNTNKFTGTFDGQDYKITDLYINRPSTDYIGLFGYADIGSEIGNVGFEDVNVTGQYYVGGLVGYNNGGIITNSYVTGNITGNSGAGGLVGIDGGIITNSYATGNVTGDAGAGGLVGENSGTITNSYATGNVTGDDDIGGLVGSNDGTITNSYATGNVTENEVFRDGFYIAGLVGSNDGTITNCYSTGFIDAGAPDDVGGLVGNNFSGTITNSFWDTETSGQTTSVGGTGKTTEEMKNVRTYTDTAWSAGLTVPWDFAEDPYEDVGTENIWNIDNTEEKNNGYSFLSWQNTSPNVPILVSPSDGLYTLDNAPTLSANYSDSDAGDTGTTNYRIAASSAYCLAGTVVTSGTSDTTLSNNATTTWIPDSSIGDDGTYYWCAQNNDGVATSDWTEMGSFILDITGPTVSLSTPANNSSTGDNTPTLIWSGLDATSGIAKYQLYIDSSLDTDNISSSATSSTPANELTCGSHTWYIRAYDNADNYTDSSTFNLTISCGGGGLPAGAYNPPVVPKATADNPQGKFSVIINNGAAETNTSNVSLKLTAGSDTKRMAISNTADFKNASQVSYQETIEWKLLPISNDEFLISNQTPNPNSQITNYNLRTVYARFYTQYGVASETVSDSIILKTPDFRTLKIFFSKMPNLV